MWGFLFARLDGVFVFVAGRLGLGRRALLWSNGRADPGLLEPGNDDPITVNMNILFELGRGPQAANDSRTYRYWIAVTDRNTAVLAKEYFDLPVNFRGQSTTRIEEEIRGIVIPRADLTTSGSNFEILIGFEVTAEMAEFNRTGSRFRINAGTAQTQQ